MGVREISEGSNVSGKKSVANRSWPKLSDLLCCGQSHFVLVSYGYYLVTSKL